VPLEEAALLAWHLHAEASAKAGGVHRTDLHYRWMATAPPSLVRLPKLYM
jgi:hypothetical protein